MSRSGSMRESWRPVAAALASGIMAGSGCSSSPEMILGCDDVEGIEVLCGFQNPEDLALLDDGRHLLVSQFGSMTGSDATGNVAIFDLHRSSLEVAYPHQREPAPANDSAGAWGDRDCPGQVASSFNPHGIDLARRPDGTPQLLVVNHGERESVEFFEVVEGDAAPRIEWRGCAIPPEDLFFNDVVALPEGGFLVTHMMKRGSQTSGLLKAYLGWNTGLVYEWQRESGFRPVPGTEAPFPNGIEISDDGKDIYLNVYGAGQVRRISRESGETLAVLNIPSPDNSSWSRDGHLMVASHTGSMREQIACMSLEAGTCPLTFEIVALDPIRLDRETVFESSGSPMGAGTVAIDIGDAWIIGTFAGDRLIRVPYSRD